MIGVVVLNYNDHDNTIEYVSRLIKFDIISRIVVIDNCSSDNSYSILKRITNDKVDVIQSEKNNGYAYGNNCGMRYLHKKYPEIDKIVISNPDILVDSNTFANLESLLDTTGFDAVAPIIMNRNNEVCPNFAWKRLSFLNIIQISLPIFRRISTFLFPKSNCNYGRKALAKSSSVMPVDVLHGCFFMIKTKVVFDCGLFSEKTFLYREEDIFFHAFRLKGYSAAVSTKDKVIHLEGQTVVKNLKKWKDIERIRHSSTIVYLKDCLHVGRLALFLNEVLYKIGYLEKKIMHFFGKRY